MSCARPKLGRDTQAPDDREHRESWYRDYGGAGHVDFYLKPFGGTTSMRLAP